jgi:putative transposase
VVSLPVLVALGVKVTGERILLALGLAGAETGATWEGVLEDLMRRHLGDDPGSSSAMATRDRGARWNGSGRVSRISVAPFASSATCWPRLPSMRKKSCMEWRESCPSVAASLEKAGEELLTFYDFPTNQHKSLRTTNAIERLQEELRLTCPLNPHTG